MPRKRTPTTAQRRKPARRFPAEPLGLADVEALRAVCSRRMLQHWLRLVFLTVAVFAGGRAGAAPFAYIANVDSGSTSIVDLATDTVVNTVGTGAKPWAVA